MSSEPHPEVAAGGAGAGGLRSSGPPLLTVITVVYNGAATLASTVESVLAQTHPRLEYIVVDGGSTDGTVAVLQQHDRQLARWISEPDQGIFDAMNKGLALARGDWVIFMNAGDRFCDDGVLASILSCPLQGAPTVVYGDTLVDYGTYAVHRKAGAAGQLWKGSQFCHQSALIRRDYHVAHRYNPGNRLCADFEFFHAAWQQGCRFLQLDRPIATITPDGVSDSHQLEVLAAWRLIASGARPSLRVRAHYVLRIALTRFALRVKPHLPMQVLQRARQGRGRLARLFAS